MPESMQKTYLELYDIANEKQIQNTNMRALQFIYHSRLIKIKTVFQCYFSAMDIWHIFMK